MPQTILYIDGENFLHKVEEVLRITHAQNADAADIDIQTLIHSTLASVKVDKIKLYAAKLHLHEDTEEKSLELIAAQRRLRNRLVTQGVEFIIAGNVRAQYIGYDKTAKVVFREKGVDVKLAVDLVIAACDKTITTAIICSSDSDLQPAIHELKKRGVKVVYLGFKLRPNKGLAYAADQTVLLRNSQIMEACASPPSDDNENE